MQEKDKKYHSDEFDIGKAEAEAEVRNENKLSLIDYFEDYLQIFSELDNGKFILIGRKGAGKSAIAQVLKKKSEGIANLHVDIIGRPDLDCLYSTLSSMSQVTSISSAYEWIILQRIAQLLLSLESAFEQKYYVALQTFIEHSNGKIDENCQEQRSHSTERNGSGAISGFGASFKAGITTRSETSLAPFNRLIPNLKIKIKECLQSQSCSDDNKFYVFFDDLDIDFNINDSLSVNRLIELIRAVKNFNINIACELNSQVVILLRDDILDYLDSCAVDISKIINSYGVELEWYDHSIFIKDTKQLPLIRLIENRIKKNLTKKCIKINSTGWGTLTNDHNYNYFKEIVEITFGRPRDLILFFRLLPKVKSNFPLTEGAKGKLLRDYTNRIVGEIKSELYNFFKIDEVEIIINALRKLDAREKRLYYSRKKLEDTLLSEKYSGNTSKALNHLFDRSIIGGYNVENKDSYFKYRQKKGEYLDMDMYENFIIHKAFTKYAMSRR